MSTRRTLLSVLALASASLLGCAGSQANERTSTTTTTGAYQAGGVDLYLARDGRAPCAREMSRSIDFASGSANIDPSERQQLDAWAKCLNEPAMKEAVIVVTGTVDPTEENALFRQRAQVIKDALVMRGVDPKRIMIAGDTREGPQARQDVHLEVSGRTNVQTFAPADPVVRTMR